MTVGVTVVAVQVAYLVALWTECPSVAAVVAAAAPSVAGVATIGHVDC